ncbi:MAG: hypothetical protein IPL73_22775 [Candidatus Obscuribacter sp.]|nr:hypothetical protein [Candidatus Obscuribacter sp.]
MKAPLILITAAFLLTVSPALAERRQDKLYISSIPQTTLPLQATPPQASLLNQPGYGHYQKGLSFKQKGDSNLALIEFLEASKENPRLTKAFYEQALIFRQKGFSKLAESALNQALALDPGFQQARILQAAVRLEAGNVGGAASSLSKSLGLEVKKGQPQIDPKVQSPKATTTTVNAVPIALQATPVNTTAGAIDNWTARLKYLNEHGTSSLKPGEAFMFSEETGEAVLFLEDGKKIRRHIASGRDNSDLVKERRPELLVPKEYVYKLSTQGRMIGATQSAVESSSELTSEVEVVKKKNNNFFDQDIADNQFTRNPLPEMEEAVDEKPLAQVQPELKTAASEAAKAQSNPEEFGESDKSFAKSGSLTEQFGVEAIVEKTQKFFGWMKKALHLP